MVKACLDAYMELKDIRFPMCDHRQSVGKQKLRTQTGFSKVKCERCSEENPSLKWRCRSFTVSEHQNAGSTFASEPPEAASYGYQLVD